MKKLIWLLIVFLAIQSKGQTLFVPSGTAGIGTSTNANTGIGTSSPQSLLHIISTANNLLKIQSVTGGAGNTAGIDFCTFSTPTSRVARIEAFDKGYFNGDLVFYTDGDNIDNANTTEKMRILMNGNVGIGTPSPNQKLEVNGSILENSENSSMGIDALSNARLGFIKKFGYFPVIASDNGNPIIFSQSDQVGVNTNVSGAILTERMRIDGSGNLGIGTPSPDAKLAVKGQIHAQEVKVDLNGSVAPDYVFNKDYRLTSLDSIKNYIDQNKHLPEVPSAAAMEKNGIQLGEMNMLLLKKIEELTLYVIELRNGNEIQKRQIENLNARIK